MKRTLIQIDDETYGRLRRQAFRTERSVSAIVRDFIARGLAEEHERARPMRVEDFASVAAGRSDDAGLAPVSERHDEALAAIYK
jgi:predicted transcriptional regulator